MTATVRRGPRVQAGPAKLTARDREILICLCEGMTNREAAKQLGLPLETLKSAVLNLYRKLGARSRANLVHRAYRSGVLIVPHR